MKDRDIIWKAFTDYYRTTVLVDETDPNKLHGLKTILERRQIYAAKQVGQPA